MKTTNQVIIVISLLSLTVACDQVQKVEYTAEVEPKTVAQIFSGFDGPMQEVLEAAGIVKQTFSLDAGEEKTFAGQKGTVLTIPKKSFITKDGKEVTGPVEVELIEAFDMTDILLLNMQTVANGEMLESDGVIYLQAKANGEELLMKEGKSIAVEIPDADPNENMQLFTGEMDEQGNVNWNLNGDQLTVSSPVENTADDAECRFFSIPLKYFPGRAKYERADSIIKLYKPIDGKITSDTPEHLLLYSNRVFYRTMLRLINNPENEGTILATREFAERAAHLDRYYCGNWYMQNTNGTYTMALNDDHYNKFYKEHCEEKLNILNVYVENKDQPFWQVDSMAGMSNYPFYHYCDGQAEYGDAVAFIEIDSLPLTDRTINLSDISEEAEVEAEEIKAIKIPCSKCVLKKFSYPVKINHRNVNLSSNDAYSQLVQNGASAAEAKATLELYNERQKVIAELTNDEMALEANLKQMEKQQEVQANINVTNYYMAQVNKLGWINIDQLYNLPNAQEITLNIDVDGREGLSILNVKLVFDERNSFLSAYNDTMGIYAFTYPGSGYKNKLPVGETATLVAIGLKDDQPMIAKKRITIGENELEAMTLAAVSIDEMKAQLNFKN